MMMRVVMRAVMVVGLARGYLAPAGRSTTTWGPRSKTRRWILGQEQKNNMPDVPESLQEPGLKVPAVAWKWPRTFPFGKDGFDASDANATASVSSGGAAILDESAIRELRGHYERHLPSGADKVLVIDGAGAGETYVPESGSGEEMWLPPNTVETMTGDALNAGDLSEVSDSTYDAVVLLHSAETLRTPRQTLREVWRVLKPGGPAMAVFSSPDASTPDHSGKVAKLWGDYDDAQRLWVVGSLFHFSAGAPAAVMAEDGAVSTEVWGAGWRSLSGYDYFDAAKKETGLAALGGAIGATGGLDALSKTASDKKPTPLFVVQAFRAPLYDTGAGPTSALDAELWASESMEEEDKRLAATRILSLLNTDGPEDPVDRERVAASAGKALRDVYGVLQPMARVIATPLLAQLAAALAPRWNLASKKQPAALKEGLGLTPPRDSFWKPLGAATEKLTVDDKLWLMADLVPLYDETRVPFDPEDGVPFLLKPVVDTVLPAALDKIQSTLFPDGTASDNGPDQADCQLLAVDLIARDYLPDALGQADTLENAKKCADLFVGQYLPTLDKKALQTALDQRRDYRDAAADKARIAAIDPEAAAQQADDLRRAKLVESMLNDIAARANKKVPT